MPYATNSDLPNAVKSHLPVAAQTIYRKAFNASLKTYGEEVSAFRVAWSAVEKAYHKNEDGKWVKGKTRQTAAKKRVAKTGRAKPVKSRRTTLGAK